MIRSRDLVLFVITILFLGVGIAVTAVVHRNPQPAQFEVSLATTDMLSEFDAVASDEEELDRKANIARLKEQLAQDTSTVTPQPDVFVTDALPDAPTDVESAAAAAEEVGVVSCLYPDDVLPKIAAWPASGVRFSIQGNQRTAYTESEAAIHAFASTSDAVQTEQVETLTTTLVALPRSPQAAPATSCVPSVVVGITLGGTMMLNDDAHIWKNVAADTLIGYARDGYPIYGRYDGAVDACGGYVHSSGYRYVITPDRPFIIGCFKAAPQSFNL